MPESITRSPARLRARSRLARSAQMAGPQPDAAARAVVDAARQDYKFVTVAEYVRQVVDAAPALTVAQRSKLAALLLNAGGTDG